MQYYPIIVHYINLELIEFFNFSFIESVEQSNEYYLMNITRSEKFLKN